MKGRMMIELHIHNTPLVANQRDMTEKQRIFLEYGIGEHINDERTFWMKLFGADTKREDTSNLRDRVETELKVKYPEGRYHQ